MFEKVGWQGYRIASARKHGIEAICCGVMQRGVQSDSFKGMLLCDQEIRLRHFHQTIDRFIDGTWSADAGAANLAPTWGLVQDDSA